MPLEFGDFHQVPFRINARQDEPPLLQSAPEGVIDLVAVPVALHDTSGLIGLKSQGFGLNPALVLTQPHGAAVPFFFQKHALLGHYINHIFSGMWRKLGGIRLP